MIGSRFYRILNTGIKKKGMMFSAFIAFFVFIEESNIVLEDFNVFFLFFSLLTRSMFLFFIKQNLLKNDRQVVNLI